ncbi:hypothetical protein [Burkholderia glumae]|uniref:hypothetical protein n=1 Tax=Burkholderia glumae TaxID=337 RepID=UPI0005BD61B1|nr:hypothetical protein [Burkholderia glumae]
MVTLVPMPPRLFSDAKAAELAGTDVSYTPDQVRMIAEIWHQDREKIQYLEGLIIRMGRHAE